LDSIPKLFVIDALHLILIWFEMNRRIPKCQRPYLEQIAMPQDPSARSRDDLTVGAQTWSERHAFECLSAKSNENTTEENGGDGAQLHQFIASREYFFERMPQP